MKRMLSLLAAVCFLFAGCSNTSGEQTKSLGDSSVQKSSVNSQGQNVSENENTASTSKSDSSQSTASQSASGYVKPASTSVITLPAEDSEDWALFLVNNYFALPEGYSPPVTEISEGKYFHSKAVGDLRKMLEAAEKSGNKLYVSSAYRSVEYQKGLFENNVQKLQQSGMSEKEARKETARNIAKPGMSEHNTGLAIDVVSSDWFTYNDDLNEGFAKTNEFKWLSKNAYKYGFILRYPENKEHITEITYEPWHYRYVGVENAKKIYNSGLTLEEYMQSIGK